MFCSCFLYLTNIFVFSKVVVVFFTAFLLYLIVYVILWLHNQRIVGSDHSREETHTHTSVLSPFIQPDVHANISV